MPFFARWTAAAAAAEVKLLLVVFAVEMAPMQALWEQMAAVVAMKVWLSKQRRLLAHSLLLLRLWGLAASEEDVVA